MTKISPALAAARAENFNLSNEVAQLKDQMAQLMLGLAAANAAPPVAQPAAEHPAVALKVESRMRCISDIYFSVTRPLMAVFIDRDAAFAYRKQLATETPGRTVRVETVTGPDRCTVLDAVY